MPNFTGSVGPVDANGYFEWTRTIIVTNEDGNIVDWFTNFEGDSFATVNTDVEINGYKVKLTSVTYEHFPEYTAGAKNLTIGAGTTFLQGVGGFTVNGTLTNNGSTTLIGSTIVSGSVENNHLMTVSGQYRYLMTNAVDGAFTLYGSGDLRLTEQGGITGFGGSGSVTDFYNQSRISGSGVIGSEFGISGYPSNGGHLDIHNTAAGTIDANRSGETLRIITPTSEANPITNQGLMAASNGGNLDFVGFSNALIYIEQTGAGKLTAYNGSKVTLTNAVVTGGKLHGQGTGEIESRGFYTTLRDVDITSSATVNVGGYIALAGDIDNRGTIKSAYSQGSIQILEGGVRLTGGGDIKMYTAYTNSVIYASTAGTVLENVDNTISGVGGIAGGNLTLINGGTISACDDGIPGADSFAIDALASITNTGVLEARDGAVLRVMKSTQMTLDNEGGVIQALGAGSVVALSRVDVTGGQLITTGGGQIEVSYATRLADLEITARSKVVATGDVVLSGDIVNRGEIITPAPAIYIGPEGVTLTGGGRVVLMDNYNTSFILPQSTATTLTNVNNTIIGDGDILGGNLRVINHGLIRADEDNNTIDTSDTLAVHDLAGLTNTGVMEARNGAKLHIFAIGDGGIRNVGGVIQAVGVGSSVDLANSTLIGGVLKAAQGATLSASGGTFDGRAETVTLIGNLTVNGGMTWKVGIENRGEITQFQGQITIAENTTLSGGGSIDLIRGYSYLAGFAAAVPGTRLNNVDNSITGGGYIGNGSGLRFTNGADAEVLATTVGDPLYVRAGYTIRNDGVMGADGGVFDIADKVLGSGYLITTNGGTLIVDRGVDQDVRFVGAAADTLALSNRGGATGWDFDISGMSVGDRIKFLDIGAGVGYEHAFDFTANSTGGVLTSVYHAEALTLAGPVSEGQFKLIGTPDGRLAYERVVTKDGTAASETLTAAKAGERVIGLGGDDILRSGAGNDVLDGSTGNDTADFSAGAATVRVSLLIDGPQAVSGRLGTDHLMSIENLIGSRFGDVLTGDGLANRIDGAAGTDTITGGGGNDTLLGGADGDTFVFVGAFGIDTIADWQDTVGVETRYDSLDRISLSSFRALNGGAKLTLDDLVIRAVSGDTWIEFDFNGDGKADRVDLDGNGSLDLGRIIVDNASVANFGATDFIF